MQEGRSKPECLFLLEYIGSRTVFAAQWGLSISICWIKEEKEREGKEGILQGQTVAAMTGSYVLTPSLCQDSTRVVPFNFVAFSFIPPAIPCFRYSLYSETCTKETDLPRFFWASSPAGWGLIPNPSSQSLLSGLFLLGGQGKIQVLWRCKAISKGGQQRQLSAVGKPTLSFQPLTSFSTLADEKQLTGHPKSLTPAFLWKRCLPTD
jgi:hypothetical protein